MDATYPGGNDLDPFQAWSTGAESGPGVPSFTLAVDGELFDLRSDEQGGTHYTWLSGPNEGYGFSSSPTPRQSLEGHRENIRTFLAQIDPATGYIEDD